MQGGAGAFGNAATRIDNYMTSRGTYVYGTYPEIDVPDSGPLPDEIYEHDIWPFLKKHGILR